MLLNYVSNEQKIQLTENLNKDDINLWNILMNHVSDDLYVYDEHEVSLQYLLNTWSQKTNKKNLGQLQQALERLGASVVYQTKKGNNLVQGFFPLLSWFFIDSDKCYFSYSVRLKQLYNYPQIAKYLNRKGITFSLASSNTITHTAINPSFLNIPTDNFNYYSKVLLRSYSLIGQ